MSSLNQTFSRLRAGLLLLVGVASVTVCGQCVVAGELAGEAEGDSQAVLVFEEDFEQGFDNWEVFDPKTWQLSSEGESKTFGITARESDYKPKYRSPWHVAMLKGHEVGDFSMTLRCRSTKDTGDHRDCCLFFGFQDREHFYYVHLGAKPDPASGQIMIVDGAARSPLTENEKLTGWTNDWHTLKVERDLTAGTIKIYFDDMSTPHMEVVDKTFGKGRVGIGSFDDMNEFDDIKLYEQK